MKNLLFTSLAGLVLGATAFAFTGDESCTSKQECPVAAKVSSLLTRWEGVAEQSKSATPEQRAALGTKVAGVAARCPVGSRLQGGLSTVHGVLGLVVAMDRESAKDCPLESAECDGAEYAQAKQLKAARVHLLGELEQLAGYASGMGCAEAAAACCASPKEASSASAGDACDDTARGAALDCPIRMAARVGELKAAFADAKREAGALTVQARGEIATGFASLAQASPAVELVPESVMALSEGFEALAKIHGEMRKLGSSHPELVAKLPASAHVAFMTEASLVEETRQLLAGMTAAMGAMQGSRTAMR